MGDRQDGFTLIEAMVALAILAFGLLAVAAMQLNAIRGSAFAEGLSEATAESQQVVETLFGTPYASMAGGNDTVTGPRGTVFTRTWAVANPTPNYATVSVTTTYVDETGKARSVSLNTVRTKD